MPFSVLGSSLASIIALGSNSDCEVDEVPDAPEAPDVPDEPDVPLVPEAPDVPAVPDAPDAPDAPDVPDELDVPLVPEAPDVPVVPDVSGAPDVPVAPVVPVVPEPDCVCVSDGIGVLDAPVLGCDGMPDCDPDCVPDEPDVLGWAGISCDMPEAPVLGCCMPGCALDGTPEAPVFGSAGVPEAPELEAPVPDCDVVPDCDCASAAEETNPRAINKAIFFFMVETSRNLE